MKEATGEANMTIITVVLIGLVSAVAVILIPNLVTSTKEKSCCTASGGEWKDGKCTVTLDETCMSKTKVE